MSEIADESPKRNTSFAGAKLDYLSAAAYDRRLKSSDFEIAFVIAQHINEKSGEAYAAAHKCTMSKAWDQCLKMKECQQLMMWAKRPVDADKFGSGY